jgi:glycerol 2-dehydrogenase (NADP+)
MSLKRLGLDYVDLYLMHWPLAMNPEGLSVERPSVPGTKFCPGNHDKIPKHPDGSHDIVKDWSQIRTWKLMEKLVSTGKVKAIGVSNYSVRYLEELLPHATVIPAVVQIENHPSLPQQEIVDFCKTKNIHVTAYSPFGSTGSPMMENENVLRIAKKHMVSPSTVLLSWHSNYPNFLTFFLLINFSCTKEFSCGKIRHPRENKGKHRNNFPRR